MKNDWKVWAIVGGVIVVVFGIFLFQARQENVSLGPTFSQQQAQRATYDFPATASAPAETVQQAAPQVAVPASGKYAIQIASFADQAKADLTQKKATENGLAAYTAAADLGDKGTWHRVYVGPFATKEEANAALSQVQVSYKNSFVIATQ